MAIRFDITGDNQNFIDSMNEVRREVEKTSQMLSSIGKDVNIDGLLSQINEIVSKFSSEKATIEVDISNPEAQLQQFDADIAKFVENLNNYFNDLKGKLEELASLLEIYHEYSKENIDKTTIDSLSAKHAALTAELNKQTEALRQQQNLYNEMLVSIQQRSSGQTITTNLDQSFAINNNTQELHQQGEATEEVNAAVNEGLDKLGQQEQQIHSNTEALREQTNELRAQAQYYLEVVDKGSKNEQTLLTTKDNGIKFSIQVPNGTTEEDIQRYEQAKIAIEETGAAIDNVVEKTHEEKEVVNEVAEAWKGVEEARTHSVTTPVSGEEIKVWAAGAEEAETKARILEERFLNLGSTIQQAYETMGRLSNIGNLSQEEQRAIDKTEELIKSLEKVQSVSQFTGEGGEDTKIGADAAKLEEKVLQIQEMIRLRGEECQKLEEIAQKTDDVAQKQKSIRTRIMEARNELVAMIEQGKAQTPEFAAAAKEAGNLRRQMALSNAAMTYYANPTRQLAALKDAMQGAIGVMSLFSGVMGLVTTQNEKFAKVQKDIQSYISILIGLETVYNKTKASSTAMLGIQEVRTWALAKAQMAQGKATLFATIQQRLFNAVAKANPYLLLISGIALLVGAIIGLTKYFKKNKEEAEKAKKKQEDLKNAMNEAASSAAKDITSYEKLRKAWDKLGDDLKEKKKFIKQNQNAFHNLGISVNNVTQAENVLVKNTATVVESLKLRARAAAAAKLAEAEMEEGLKKENDLRDKWIKGEGKGQHKQFKEGQVVKKSDIDELGLVEGRDYEYVGAAGYTGSYKIKGTKNKNGTLTANAVVNRQNGREYNKQKKEIQDEANSSAQVFIDLQQQAEQQRNQMLESADIQDYDELTDKKDKGGKQFDPKEAAYQQKKLQEKYNDEIEEYAKKLQQQNTAATIENMDESTQKELAKIEEDKKQKLAAIEKEIDDLVEKRKELDKQVWLKGGKDRKENQWAEQNTKTDEDYRQEVLAQEVKDEQGNIITFEQLFASQRAEIHTSTTKAIQKANEAELKAYREYLKKYGTLAQIRQAIDEGYDQQIKEAPTEGEKLQLQKEREEAQSRATFENIAMGIDWNALFNGLGTMSEEMMRVMREKLEAYTQTDEYRNADTQTKQDVANLINEMTKYLGSQEVSFGQLANAMYDFNRSLVVYEEAQKAEVEALRLLTEGKAEGKAKVESGEMTEEEYTTQITTLQENADAASQAVIEAKTEVETFGGKLNQASQAVANYTSEMSATLQNAVGWQGVEGYDQLQAASQRVDKFQSDAQQVLADALQSNPEYAEAQEAYQRGEITKEQFDAISNDLLGGFGRATQEMVNVVGNAQNFANDMLGSIFGDALGQMVGMWLQLPKMIMLIADVIKNFVTGIFDSFAEFFAMEWIEDLVNSILESIGNLINVLWDFPENLYHVVESIIVKGIGGLLNTIIGRVANVLTFGGLGSGGPADWFRGGNAEEIEKKTEELTASNDRLRNSVEKLKTSIDKSAGVAAIKDYEKAYEAQQRINEQTMEILQAQMSYTHSHHSNAKNWKLSQGDYQLISELLGVKISSLADIYKLTPEEMDDIRTYLPEVWQDMLDQGDYDKSEFWENYADLAGELTGLTDQINENLTQTSFDSLRDSFVSSLMDMDKSAYDFAHDFENYMMKALLNSAVGNQLDEQLEDWYKKWAKTMQEQEGSLTRSQIEQYKHEWEAFVQQGIQTRDQLADLTGYSGSDSESNGTFKSASSFTAEQGDILNGRLTAIQISSEKRNALLTGIMASLDTYRNINTEHNAVVSEIRSQIVQSNSYLADIALYSRNIYRSFGEKIDTLITNTQYL